MGKTALYDLARESSIPCNRVGNKWLFNKDDLDVWVRANKPIERFFLDTAAHKRRKSSVARAANRSLSSVIPLFSGWW
jgi:excisionase family DNA binding protein